MAKILYVEDHPTLAYGVKSELEARGHSVTHVSSCEQALPKIKQGYDIILSDFNLGRDDLGRDKMNGGEFAKQVHESGADVPLIILSANDWDDVRRDGKLDQAHPETGQPVTGFISKIGLDIRVLDQTINTLVAQRGDRVAVRIIP